MEVVIVTGSSGFIGTVEAIAIAVERRRQRRPEETFLIGEPIPMNYDELQRALGRLIHGEEWETRVIPKALAA